MGMQVLFPVAVHPVILPGRVGKADNRGELIMILNIQSGILALFHGRTMVVCESGREPEAVHQFYLVHQLGIVVLEILQVEIVETDWGIF